MTTTSVSSRSRLTAKQEAFALLLFQDISQREAWVRAGYSSKMLPSTIDENASRLAHNSKVITRITELRAKAESDAIGTVSERKKRLTEIYRANLTDFVDQNGNLTLKPSAALAEVTVDEHILSDGEDGEKSLLVRTKKLKLRDPVAAIVEQNRMERIGQTDTIINNTNDNRTVNIIVKSEEGRQALEQLKSGKLPQLEGKG